MALSDCGLVRIAHIVRDQLMTLRAMRHEQVHDRLSGLVQHTQRVQRVRGRLARCNARAWHAAGASIINEAENSIRELPHLVEQVRCAVHSCNVRLPTVKDVYEDLVQTQDEFGDLTYEPREGQLAVVTESIELDGVYLGTFQIELYVCKLPQIRSATVYNVVALDPQPAQGNVHVTHPHVSENRLCAGDATVPIHEALVSGRLCDVFMLVRSVLTHYNSASPYVAIENWQGRSCHECGRIAPSDESYWCSGCENELCDECAFNCARCDDNYCRSCLEECEGCESLFCPSCRTTCPDCETVVCQSCRGEGQCDCLADDEENDDDESEEDIVAGDGDRPREEHPDPETPPTPAPIPVPCSQAHPPVLADSVGQVAVLPG